MGDVIQLPVRLPTVTDLDVAREFLVNIIFADDFDHARQLALDAIDELDTMMAANRQ